MAIAFDVDKRFAAPPERVFAALTNLDAAGEWMPGFVGIERVAGAGFEPGTQWRETRKVLGRQATEHFEVTECVPPRRIGLRVDGAKGTTGKGEYLFTYDVVPDGDGTLVRLHGEIGGLSGLSRLIAPLLVGTFRKACARDLDALETWLASRPGSGARAG